MPKKRPVGRPKGSFTSNRVRCNWRIAPAAVKKMYHFANLADVWDVIREKVAESELFISQPVGQIKEANGSLILGLKTTLLHTSGEWVSDDGEYPVPAGTRMMNLAQAFGSALTYARRYGLCSILGIVAGDDDDAKRALAAAGKDAGPNLSDRPTMTWQAIHEAGTWRACPNMEDGGATTLGDLSGPELQAMMVGNSKRDDPDPGIVASSAYMLMAACNKRNTSLPDALEKVSWKGTRALLDMTARDIILAYNAITAPVKPKTEEPSA